MNIHECHADFLVTSLQTAFCALVYIIISQNVPSPCDLHQCEWLLAEIIRQFRHLIAFYLLLICPVFLAKTGLDSDIFRIYEFGSLHLQ
jgi:hypothetical protein